MGLSGNKRNKRNETDVKYFGRTDPNAHRVASSSNNWYESQVSFDSEYNWSFS